MNTHQVNYEIVYVEGALKGNRYHRHQLFTNAKTARIFADRDGSIIKPHDGRDAWRQEASSVIDLATFA